MDPLEELLNEVRLLWHRLVRTGETLHAGEPITLGMRAVLERLAREGAATVPGIARGRHVTRQHIQALVNGLLERKLVELRDNPAHKRSPLVGLTPPGAEAIRRMKRKEARWLAGRDLGVSPKGLTEAAAVLRAVRAGLARRRT
jgi:DNA-binding MarR family transcriptional regulator